VIAAALFLPGGCDLFQTRDPVVATGDDSIWVQPTEPEIIVENLRNAFEEAIFNDYTRTFTDDFVFIPDQSDVAQLEIDFPGQPIYDGWNRAVETDVAETIRGAVDSVRVAFEEPILEDLPEGVLLKYEYVLALFADADSTFYEGEAWFLTRVAAGEYRIAEWSDVASSPTRPSWGLLKGRNRLL
jgi:hypothetical protein